MGYFSFDFRVTKHLDWIRDNMIKRKMSATVTDKFYYTYVATIHKKEEWLTGKNMICSGVIVGKRIVLTAASCMEGRFLNETRVVVGFYNLDQHATRDFIHSIYSMHYHPLYLTKDKIGDEEDNNIMYDFAVLKLYREIWFSEFVEMKPLDYPRLPVKTIFIGT